MPLPSNSTAPQESIDSPSIDAEAAVESLAEVLSSLPQPAANTSGSAIAAMARIRAVGRFGVGFIAGSYDSGAGRTAVQSRRQDYSTGRGPPRGREMTHSRQRPELLLIILALAAAIAVFLIAFPAGDSRPGGVDLAEAATPPAAPAPGTSAQPTAAPARATPERDPGIILPDGGTPILTVRDGAEVPLRDAAGGHVVDVLTDTTEFGSPTVLSRSPRGEGNWVGVPTELLPNGELGWVKLDPRRLQDRLGRARRSSSTSPR